MTVKCEVIRSGNDFYYSGQIFSGRICLSLDDRILIKALALKIRGYAMAEWNAAKKETAKRDIVHGFEDFIATTTYLIGSEESSSIMIPVGSYTYSFSCAIPEKSPSSFESPCGHIRYQIKVVIYYPDRSDEILVEPFQVVKALDLRPQALVLKLPLDMEVYEKKCCAEYWKTPLCLYVNLPQAGFVCGDTISIYARLLNEGQIPLKHISFSLNQVVVYKARIPRQMTKTERFNITTLMNGLAGKEPLREFLERIPIPSLPPTCDTDCSVLQVSYEVEAVVVPVKGDRGVVVRIPVLIGTTSFEADNKFEFETKNEKPVPEDVNGAVPATIISSSALEAGINTSTTNITSAPIPSFQEASYMAPADFKKEDKHSLNQEKAGFKPQYMYYEVNEEIEMTPTTMEITKEITITSQ